MRKGSPKRRSARERTGLASRLIAARVNAGLTQEALAELAGVSIATIKAIEAGTNTNPKHDTLLDLAAACGVDASALTDTGASLSGKAWMEFVDSYLVSPEGRLAEESVTDPLEKERGRQWLRSLNAVVWPDGRPSFDSLTYMLAAYRKRERRSSRESSR